MKNILLNLPLQLSLQSINGRFIVKFCNKHYEEVNNIINDNDSDEIYLPKKVKAKKIKTKY